MVKYTIEAHPAGPASPYSGKESLGSASSDRQGNPLTQLETYEERVGQASKSLNQFGIGLFVRIDEMDNPAWCTYGPAPNTAYLTGSDGDILEELGQYQSQRMEAALAKYLEANNRQGNGHLSDANTH